MQFESAPPSIVRSVRQRDLLNTWLRLRVRVEALPAVRDYEPARLEDELKDIVYYVVQRDRSGWRFIIDSHGSRLAQAYGKGGGSNIGTDLRDYVGPAMVNLVLPIYETCTSRALPVYSISLVNDTDGRTVAYERLLMPFFTGDDVDHRDRAEHRSFVASKLLLLLERTIGADGLERSDDGSVGAGDMHKMILCSAR